MANRRLSGQSYDFSSSHIWMRELDYKENWALKNWCLWTVVLEKTLESLLDCKKIQPVHTKGNQSWIFIKRTDTEAETQYLGHLMGRNEPWCWERFRVGGEGDDRGWDGWMASPTWWTWVSVNSRRQWRTQKPGVLPSMGSQRIGHNWVNWTELNLYLTLPFPPPTSTIALLGILSLWQLFTPTVRAPQLANSCLWGLPPPHGALFSSIPLTSTQFPFPLYTIL